jgi:acyl carrier protein
MMNLSVDYFVQQVREIVGPIDEGEFAEPRCLLTFDSLDWLEVYCMIEEVYGVELPFEVFLDAQMSLLGLHHVVLVIASEAAP